MSDEEMADVRAAADHAATTVSEWVRATLREERARQRRGHPPAVRESTANYDTGRGLADRVHVELELRSDLIEAVRARFHLTTPRAAVEYALRRAAIEPMSRDEVLEMEGTGWDGNLDTLRSGDPGLKS